ncbi:tetratricopeptide repeat protein [Rubrivivax albus]|uniref:tetratricopeptide repeat protein n=1 Tax=Rubrivivax albus TaxID=2499835 RepID=UPI001305184A|nr:tetratricopeptide repeat protein [Rubrivivax albus]
MIVAATVAAAAGTAAAPLDLRAMWDFARPDVSEQRFRDRLATATPDEALILQTQIARTYGLRKRLDDSRALLQSLRPQLDGASAEARVRWQLEWGRTWASAVHDRETLPEADRETARTAFRAATDQARAAGLDALAVDALHMLPFTTADRAQDLVWNQEALALALASSQPDARRWEASLRNNIGITLNDLGRHAEALTMLQQALAALQQQAAPAGRQRIGHWMVANTLRRLGRIDEALAIQQRLEAENAADGTPDAYVFEELALLHRARGDTAQADAYDARAKMR